MAGNERISMEKAYYNAWDPSADSIYFHLTGVHAMDFIPSVFDRKTNLHKQHFRTPHSRTWERRNLVSSPRSLPAYDVAQGLRNPPGLFHTPFRASLHVRLNVPEMSLFSYIRSIYALDTIDTRFTNSSNTPYQTVVDARADGAPVSKRDDSVPGAGVKTDRSGRPIAQPSRWNTTEYRFYYFVFLTIVPYMFWIAYDVSRR